MIDTKTAPYAALLLRSALGTMFIAHALLKVLVFTPEGTAGFFASLGIPGWLAYPTIGVELIGGLLLVLGIQTRIVSLGLVPVLIGSIVLVHGAHGWLFTNENGGWEYPLFLIVASVVQALLGDGAYSLNRFFAPSIRTYLQRIHGLPGIRETVNPEHIKAGYYSIRALNPTGIVPSGPATLW